MVVTGILNTTRTLQLTCMSDNGGVGVCDVSACRSMVSMGSTVKGRQWPTLCSNGRCISRRTSRYARKKESLDLVTYGGMLRYRR